MDPMRNVASDCYLTVLVLILLAMLYRNHDMSFPRFLLDSITFFFLILDMIVLPRHHGPLPENPAVWEAIVVLDFD